MAGTGGTTSYSPISLLTGSALAAPKPVAAVARPAAAPTTAAKPVTLSSIMGSSSGSSSSKPTVRPTGIAAAPNYGGIDQFLGQHYVAPAQRAQAINNAWVTGDIIPWQTNSITRETRPAIPNMLQPVIDAFKLPGDVLSGRNQNFSPGYATEGGISDALNFMGAFGTLGMAMPRPSGSLGMFGFKHMPNTDMSRILAAEKAARTNLSPEYLVNQRFLPPSKFKEAGDAVMNDIYRQYDVFPQFRINAVGNLEDYGSLIHLPMKDPLKINLNNLPKIPDNVVDPMSATQYHVPLRDIANVDQFSPQYVGIGDIPTVRFSTSFMKDAPQIAGLYSPSQNVIGLHPNQSPSELYDTLIHEVTHPYQQITPFTPKPKPYGNNFYDYHTGDTGEFVARLNALTGGLTEASRANVPMTTLRDVASYNRRMTQPLNRMRFGAPTGYKGPMTVKEANAARDLINSASSYPISDDPFGSDSLLKQLELLITEGGR